MIHLAHADGIAFSEASVESLVQTHRWGTESLMDALAELLDLSERLTEYYERDRDEYRVARQEAISSTFREALAAMDAEASRAEASYMHG